MKQWLDDNTLPVIVILGMIVTMFAALTYGYEIENCHAKNTYSQVPESIFGCPISEDIERITAQENQWAYDDQQRQEIKIADHKAQVEMAYYAKVGLILALFGSWLLYWTLSYTRDAAQAAAKTLGIAHDTLTHSKEVSLTEQRPWIFIERDVACEFNFSERGVQLYWRYVVQNIGKTPAYHFVRKQTIVRSDTIVINEKQYQTNPTWSMARLRNITLYLMQFLGAVRATTSLLGWLTLISLGRIFSTTFRFTRLVGEYHLGPLGPI